MPRVITMEVPQSYEDDLKREMRTAALEAFQATARKHQYAEYMQRQTAAEYIGVSVTTLDNLTKSGLPVSIVDGLKLWRKASIDKYMLEHQI